MATHELYRIKPDQEVDLPIPDEFSVSSVTIKSPVSPDGEEYQNLDGKTVTLPFKHTLYDGEVVITARVNIENEEVEIIKTIPVVTPLFTIDDFSTEDLSSMNYASPDDIIELERFIRHVIEAHTGQSFGYFRRTFEARFGKTTRFDVPVLVFTGISDRYVTESATTIGSVSYEVVEGGFGVQLNDNYHTKTDTFWMTSSKNRSVFLHGKFGYVSVPESVRQAALILAGLWGCNQAIWRDRYINTIRSADWNIKYDAAAYEGTGSATADQLLAQYVRGNGFMAVI